MRQKLTDVERLRPDHDVREFDSGQSELDDWLRQYAVDSDRRDIARTFVMCRGAERVVGYYSLTMGSVRATEPPPKLVRGLPRYPIAMVLLARLAVDTTEQGHGVGAMLLADALVRAVRAGESAAARLFVVDALDDKAAAFYGKHGLLPAPDNPHRLYRRLKDVRASIEAAAKAGLVQDE